MIEYSLATGIHTSIYDHNYASIFESADTISGNACLCKNDKKYTENEIIQTLVIKEAETFGAPYVYTCPSGCVLWSAPLYLNKHFLGALLAVAPSSKGPSEEGPAGEGSDELGQKIKALAELMLICAKSLSAGSKGWHEAVKRRWLQQSDLAARLEEIKNQPSTEHKGIYPFKKEEKLLEAFRQKDITLAKQLLNEIFAVLIHKNSSAFSYIKSRALELAFLLSSASLSLSFTVKNMLEHNSRNVPLIQKTKNIKELNDVMHCLLDDLSKEAHSFQGIIHVAAFKKAEEYIMENFTRKITLAEIARISGFSISYFSTIFKEEKGENFSNYLNRLRVEKAAELLTGTKFSLSYIAKFCGFEDQSWFSKTFKAFTGKSPGQFRRQMKKPAPKIPEITFLPDYP